MFTLVVRHALPVGIVQDDAVFEKDVFVIWWVRQEFIVVDMANWVGEVMDVCGGRYKIEFLSCATSFEVEAASLVCL